MVNASQSRGAYNLPPGERDVDDRTYNPTAEFGTDKADYNVDADSDMHLVGARGGSNQPTFRDYEGEDAETARSDQTGQIPRGMIRRRQLTCMSDLCIVGEVEDLLSSATDEERNVSSYTRGNRVDAFKQERDIDRAFDDAGISEGQQDVEINAAVGRG